MGVILTECIQSNLSLIKEDHQVQNKRYLGTLKGVCAECDKPTRNERIYSRALWEKVLNSDSVKEGLENKVIYGELGHPEDRLESDIQKIAICFSGYDIQPDGVIIGYFDILDTPSGQLLKSLVDYGSILGISSRGGGDTYMREGKTYVSEDNYQFMCFDIVLTPGVKAARLGLTESVQTLSEENIKPLEECAQQIISTTSSIPALQNLKYIMEQLELPNKEKLISDIDEKLCNNVSGETIPDTVLEDLKSYQEKVSTLQSQLNESQMALQAETIRCGKLEEKLGKVASSSKYIRQVSESLRSKLEQTQKTNAKEVKDEVDRLTEQCEFLKKTLHKQKVNNDLIREQFSTQEKKYADMDSSYKTKLREATQRIKEYEKSVQEAQSLKESYEEKLANTQKDNAIVVQSLEQKLVEMQQKVQSVTSSNKRLAEDRQKFIKAYVDTVGSMYGINCESVLRENINMPFTKIHNMLMEQVNSNTRLSALPFTTNSTATFKGINEDIKIEEYPKDYGVDLLLKQNK